jgi:hypothetical protein
MSRMHLLAWPLGAAWFLLGVAFAQPPREAARVAISLEDQFQQPHALSDHAGDVVVLLYGDRQGMPANKEIGERLHAHYHPAAKGRPPAEANRAPVIALPGLPEGKRSPDVRVIPVACFGSVPKVVQTVIRNQVKKNAPETAVWLDFEGKMKETFGLKPGVPNLVVIDAQGRPRLKGSAELDGESYAKLLGMIDALRREAAGIR